MKKIDLPLWSDTLCLFFCLLLFFFAVFRFSLPLWAAALLAAAASAAAAVLLFLFLQARRKARHTGEREKTAARKLAFHLAMSPPEENAALLAACLNAAAAKNERGEAAPAAYRAVHDGVIGADEQAFVRFRFEKVTADELSPILRSPAAHKAVYASAFTDEAKKLADAFGLRLVDAAEMYALVQDCGQMPDPLLAPPAKKEGALHKLRQHLHRRYWRGYAFAGVSLLLFSLLTIFPVYYIVTGSLLLAAALLLRFFGKKD